MSKVEQYAEDFANDYWKEVLRRVDTNTGKALREIGLEKNIKDAYVTGFITSALTFNQEGEKSE